MNKKAESTLLGEHGVNGIISIIVLVILIGFVFTAVIFFWPSAEDTHLKQAINQLNKIVAKVNHVYEWEDLGECVGEECLELSEETLDIFPPSGWFLRTFPDYDFPEGECRRKNSCLCICKSIACDDKKELKCEGFDFDVEVLGDYETSQYIPSPSGVPPVRHDSRSLKIKYSGLMKLEPVEVLKVFKEEDIVKIRK